jgi:hypothetical protein
MQQPTRSSTAHTSAVRIILKQKEKQHKGTKKVCQGR